MSARDEIATTLRHRLVQTNEVRRAAVLYLALGWLRTTYDLDEIALVEVGASAGLLLAADRYGYQFGSSFSVTGQPHSLAIETDLRGDCSVRKDALPEILVRTGIDLAVLNVSDSADRRWLRALIWGDQPERLARLDAAIDVARGTPMQLNEGDANDILPGVLRNLRSGLPAVVFHSHTLNQFPEEARKRFDNALRHASLDRIIVRISMEGGPTGSICSVSVYGDVQVSGSTDLAYYDAHGAWIEWLVSAQRN